MLQGQCIEKRKAWPKPVAPFQSASGISILGALRFELSWRYRDHEPPREKQASHE